jgi:hypothetical protein
MSAMSLSNRSAHQMRVGLGVDQLGVNADPVAGSPDAPLQQVTHAQLAADSFRVYRLVPVCEGGIARDHEHIGDPREIGRQILGDAIREILLIWIVAKIVEWQHDD